MKNKNLLLVIVIMLGLAMSFGCTSSDNSKAVQSEPTPTPAQVSTPTPTPAPTPTATPATKVTSKPEESASPVVSKTTLQFSESKQDELIKYTKQYGAKDVEVAFAQGKNGNGFVSVIYIVDTIPEANTLNNNMATVLILSRQLAKESGIPNPDVNVIAMLEDGRGLGVGNYFASTGKTDIDVSDCHW